MAARKRARISKAVRELVWQRSGGVCYLCNEPIDRSLPHQNPGAYQVEHVKSLAAGGDNAVENYRAAHRRCNSKKGDKPVSVAKAKQALDRGESRRWF